MSPGPSELDFRRVTWTAAGTLQCTTEIQLSVKTAVRF